MSDSLVRGAAMVNMLRTLSTLAEAGRIAPDELEEALPPAARKLVAEGADPRAWYPMEIYGHVADLLCRLEGDGGWAYLRGRGVRAAHRFAGGGILPELSRLHRMRVETVDDLAHAVRLVTSMYTEFFTVGSWIVSRAPGAPSRLRVDVHNAADYPESLRHAVEGFLAGCMDQVAPGVRCTSERPTPDRIVVHLEWDPDRRAEPA